MATCEQVHTLLTTEHNEILIWAQPDRPTSPTDLVRVNKDLLLQVLESNLSRARISFDELNKKPVPTELTAQHAAAVTAQEFGTMTGSPETNTKLNSAMTALAGKNCQATG